jgi:tetratricopeptide (TPR) repeat protein
LKLKRGPILAFLAVLAIFQAATHLTAYATWKKNYAPAVGDYSGLSPDQFLFALAGFRELVAGILWVRADAFFDEGNFDAILPIIRLVTILDPHQIDVYATGMWHIAYNFTDEGSRSDRRYIPSAVALGVEGAKNNPQTYELFYETGWLYYHKIEDDFDQSVKWFEQAMERPDVITARRNILNMAYQRAGMVDKATNYLDELLTKAEQALEDGKKSSQQGLDLFQLRQNRDTLENIFDNHLIRMAQRGWLAKEGGYYDSWEYDTKPPFDVGFSAQVTVVDPKVIRVIGTWNVVPVGTRVRIVLRDANYPAAKPGGLEWYQGQKIELDPPKDLTFMQDQLFVRNQRFDRRIDMGRDPTMYPFVADEYLIEFYYSPRQAPAYIQDKFGWNGEGMTDKNFLNTEIRPGQRVIYTTLKLTRDQLLRRGPWKDQAPTVQTSNFRGVTLMPDGDNIIRVPGILTNP